MLQIITGKFFEDPEDVYVTSHRGVLYTNYRLQRPVDTASGKLLPVEHSSGVGSVVYEVEERLPRKRPDGTREFLKGVGGQYFFKDFAAVTSFALNVTCTPERDLARRLTHSTHAPLGAPKEPKEYVKRAFDEEVQDQPEDGKQLSAFVDQLVGLRRDTYEAVMKAIRQYVVGLHRVADNPTLAYTLLVAAAESLVQDFDAFEADWSDYNPQKRRPIDKALGGATESVAERVRSALLEIEHVALTRRCLDFVEEHVRGSFYRAEAKDEAGPLPKRALRRALREAYRLRSKYVHALSPLPAPLSEMPSCRDYTEVEGKPVLTLHGLARLVRHVITTFVNEEEKVEREEDIDHRSRLPNIVRMPLAPSVWVGHPAGYDHESATRYLEGFLSQIARFLSGESEGVTDISQVLEEIERQAKGVQEKQRRPMLTLYVLHSHTAGKENRRPGWDEFIGTYDAELEKPSVEALVLQVVLGFDLGWPAEKFEEKRVVYYRRRYHKGKLKLPPLFEAALDLEAAERYRRAGRSEEARQLIGEAVETLPGNEALIAFEKSVEDEDGLQKLEVIDWRELLLDESMLVEEENEGDESEKAAEPGGASEPSGSPHDGSAAENGSRVEGSSRPKSSP